jgi:hypothetical protein
MDQPMKGLTALLVAGLATTAAHANDIFVGATPLNIPGAFMPGTLPPEPPAIEGHQRGHAAWAKIPNIRQIKPHLERHEGVFHAPASRASVSADTAVTGNWSGSAVVGVNNQYASGATYMSVLMPGISAAFGTDCAGPSAGKTNYVAIWNGIDGFGGSTVEQAGISAGMIACQLARSNPFIEVYPEPEVGIDNFYISPGDMVDIWTWVVQSAKLTCAAWENESQQKYTTACLTAPGAFPASTVEWVVERPQIGGGFTTLSNYITVPIWSTMAWDYRTGIISASAVAPPSAWGSAGTLYSISMTDNSGNLISEPNARWYDTLFMYDTGPAYCQAGASCQPRF